MYTSAAKPDCPKTGAKQMIIKYNTAVFTPAGWRSEVVTAQAEAISPKRLRVVNVIDIGGNGATGYGSRTGAKRQAYNVGGVALREVGAVKLTGKVEILDVQTTATDNHQ
jgi:hypothetical protein